MYVKLIEVDISVRWPVSTMDAQHVPASNQSELSFGSSLNIDRTVRDASCRTLWLNYFTVSKKGSWWQCYLQSTFNRSQLYWRKQRCRSRTDSNQRRDNFMGPVKGINIKRGDLIANQTRNMTLIADRSDNSNIKRLLEVVCVYVILQRGTDFTSEIWRQWIIHRWHIFNSGGTRYPNVSDVCH